MKKPPSEAAAGRKLRVVIADDSASLRKLLRQLCCQVPGLEPVGEAEDGVQALERIHQLKPDVLILDFKMPRLGGAEVLQALPREARPKVIIVWTGLPKEMYRDQCKDLGVKHFFEKGRQVHELTATLRHLAAHRDDKQG